MRISFVHAISIVLIGNFCASQLHQDDYDIEQDRIDIPEYNKTACKNLTIKVSKYNETLRQKAISLTIYLTQGVYKEVLLTLTLYKNVQKKYRMFPIPNITLDLCEAYHNADSGGNILGVQNAIKLSNFRGCPAGNGKKYFYLNNWILEQDKFIPHLPGGDYMLRVHAAIDNIFVLVAEWHGAIVKKQKKRKH